MAELDFNTGSMSSCTAVDHLLITVQCWRGSEGQVDTGTVDEGSLGTSEKGLVCESVTGTARRTGYQ